MSRTFMFRTVDVFTSRPFGGNPLAVFPDARGLTDAEMQALAAEMNLSETSFVLPPADPRNTARVRIFNRTAEMPFAGHPNVGTAFVLARLRPELGDRMLFEEMAGIVDVRLKRGGGQVTSAEIDAPQPLRRIADLDPNDVAPCIGLTSAALVVDTHRPVLASVGVDFVLAEVTPDALASATPDIAAFRDAAAKAGLADRYSLFVYTRQGSNVRARMFAPLSGTWEDPATGSANATLGALLLSLSPDEEAVFRSVQGVEMGRRSDLLVTAWRASDGIRARVAGDCQAMFSGEVSL